MPALHWVSGGRAVCWNACGPDWHLSVWVTDSRHCPGSTSLLPSGNHGSRATWTWDLHLSNALQWERGSSSQRTGEKGST